MTMAKHTAIYVRVSTTGQDLASQLPDLERWAEAHTGKVVWYRDKFTGKTMDRPGMNDLVTDLVDGKIERIVVWRLDRLGRTAAGMCAFFNDLKNRGVDLVSLKDGFSLNTPAGKLHAQIIAAIAEYETEVRAERVKAGQAAARARGKRWGGGAVGRRVRVDKKKEASVKRRYKDGQRIADIASLEKLSRPTVYAIIRGERKYNDSALRTGTST
jgi:DNA invertase Pin-like site-specific DNA recombinase